MAKNRPPVNFRSCHTENAFMSDFFPPDVREDLQAVIDHITSGKPLDPEVARRVSERSRAVQEELVRRFGTREIAVDLIRRSRDEE
jgi:hypothetical protein